MYEAFFGLESRPFATVPDPRFLYWAEAHEFAYTMLRHCVMTRSPLNVMTGEAGVGKTTLIRQLLHDDNDNLLVGHVTGVRPARGELLQWAMTSLGLPAEDGSYLSLFNQFKEFLEAAHFKNSRVMLVFDEAQNFDAAMLEEARLLSNLNVDDRETLMLLLVGQPELREALARPELEQVRRRITFDFSVTALAEDEVAPYVDHRLAVSGADRHIFDPEVCGIIHNMTGGVPHSVNIVCDMCMIYAYSEEREVVDDEVLRDFLKMMRDRKVFSSFLRVNRT